MYNNYNKFQEHEKSKKTTKQRIKKLLSSQTISNPFYNNYSELPKSFIKALPQLKKISIYNIHYYIAQPSLNYLENLDQMKKALKNQQYRIQQLQIKINSQREPQKLSSTSKLQLPLQFQDNHHHFWKDQDHGFFK